MSKNSSFAKIQLDWQTISQSLNFSGQMGFMITIPLLFGIIGGSVLDKRAGTSPLFVLLGTGLGLIAAIYGTIKILKERLKHG
ncbi:AtpZ/AtpI family protein [Patescibacteria group bacterium]|nr:AtpZ/AtpI family protein [Patescibacteria group bacterium]MBU1931898.1 AtpZ/AtpI family protein [Patescibacteria group bacterium]